MNAILLPALGGMLLLVVLNELCGDKRWGFAKYLAFLEVNGRTFVELVGILAGCGLLIGAFSLTGVISAPGQRPAGAGRQQRAAAAGRCAPSPA